MLALLYMNQFKKDLKLVSKRGKKLSKLNDIIDTLLQEKPLPEKNRNHKLGGDYIDHWECHIEPDWLLIYLKSSKTLTLVRTGSHTDLF
ncbi:MAG: type II toxin-antitoxin system YafQ family toxin [Rhabdochlamydiaceae bacterium]|jgi:mRNA interferase YafQ|nr:type II toxin-antitoxin system YafQ family toxin [Rhabdochlamydiaceae bacterium]